jgi:hypothetical protein
MLYRNVKTGDELMFSSVIYSPDWELVEDKKDKAQAELPRTEAPEAELVVKPVKKEIPKKKPVKKRTKK